jgi:hypothetical protein
LLIGEERRRKTFKFGASIHLNFERATERERERERERKVTMGGKRTLMLNKKFTDVF